MFLACVLDVSFQPKALGAGHMELLQLIVIFYYALLHACEGGYRDLPSAERALLCGLEGSRRNDAFGPLTT